MLHADTTETPGQHHIHYIGPGAVMRDFTLKVEVKLSADGANGGIQYRSRLLHPAYGGSLADPLGKPLPGTFTTMDQAVKAGITAAPAARGAGPGGGRGPGGGGAPGGGAPPAAPAPNPCVGEVGNLAAAAPAGRGNATRPATGNPWQVSGYQFDLDSSNGFTGQLYEGQGLTSSPRPARSACCSRAIARFCSARSRVMPKPPSSRIKGWPASGSRSRSSCAGTR